MTRTQLNQAYAYLTNPLRRPFIEAEIANSSQRRFEDGYAVSTTGYPLPINTYEMPYFVLPANADKWGIELRLYFIADNLIPDFLHEISTGNNRPGYEQYNRRINNNELINYLFERGFILGEQDIARYH